MYAIQGLALLAAAAGLTSAAPKPLAIALEVDVTTSSPRGETFPTQYGLMFEDINYCGDGGLYAELVRNRAFQANSIEEASTSPWFSVGGSSLTLRDYNSLSVALPFHVNVAAGNSSGQVGLANPGWWGIDVRPQTYTGSFFVNGAYNGNFYVTLGSNLTSDVFATTTVKAKSRKNKWTQVHYTLEPTVTAPNSNNTLSITFDSASATGGSLNFNLLSLFPPTFKNRPNGLRPDLMEALAGLTGSYLRFPGGNNIEGNGLRNGSPRWIWNNTIGPLQNRPGRMGTWGYYNTDGLGLHEYFQWCEDLDLEPVYAIWDGLYLDGEIVPQDQLQPYIQEALDAIEYITGSTSTRLGALRAANGRTQPWKLNYVEIGNEDFLNGGSSTYTSYRYPMFYAALTAAYPNITTFSSYTGIPQAIGAFNDYHIYSTPDDFVSRYHQSDYVNNDNPAMVGEYAAVANNYPGGVDFGNLNPHPTWIGSVGEAVYLLGLEVNAFTIFGASYAPTFQNLNSWQWGTDMISFQADTTKTVLSTSWHIIKLLSETRFTQSRTVNSSLPAGPIYWAAGLNEDTGSSIIKFATYNTTFFNTVPMAITFPGVTKGTKANLTILTAPDAFSFSSVGADPVVANTEMLVAGEGGVFTFGLPNWAVGVLATVPKGYKGTTGLATGFKGFGGYGGCKGGREKTSTGNGC